jgi:molybdate/tungstate transport system ATP-binding protein
MIKISNLNLYVGDFHLKDINLEVSSGKYFILMGPPGSGKTLLAECICGLRKSFSGQIIINDKNVTEFKPKDRHIGYMPQDYVLFPTKSVRENISFGMKLKRWPEEKIKKRIKELLDLLGIDYLLSRSVRNLSGGERQKVALGRALSVQPSIIILDEPVSALSETMREKICLELKEIQKKTGITFFHICHNLQEMWLLADEVGIMQNGNFIQTGHPDEILKKPLNINVGRFLGAENILEGISVIKNNRFFITVDNLPLPIYTSKKIDGAVTFMIRPEDIVLVQNGKTSKEENIFSGEIKKVIRQGVLCKVQIDIGFIVTSLIFDSHRINLGIKEGDRILIKIPSEAVYIFP